MADFALPALVTAAAALLSRSGGSHLLHRTTLRALLDQQALLPTSLRPIVAAGLGPIELVLAVAMAAALVSGGATVIVGGLVATVGLTFSGLLLALARTRPGTPCGCHGATDADGAGIGPLDGLRAGVVFAGGLALAGGAAPRLATLDAGQTATVLVAGLALAAVIDVAARIQPSPQPPTHPAPAGLGRGTGS